MLLLQTAAFLASVLFKCQPLSTRCCRSVQVPYVVLLSDKYGTYLCCTARNRIEACLAHAGPVRGFSGGVWAVALPSLCFPPLSFTLC